MRGDLHRHGAEILRPAGELSKAEAVKAASAQLRGTLAAELLEDTPVFSGPAEAVLKFHGVYQQEDRDVRRRARDGKVERRHQMMSRTRVPGGVLSADGWLAHDAVSTRWGDGTIRITTRQAIQLHGVLKGDLKSSLRAINETLYTTLGGCGDHERNIMSCPFPHADAVHGAVRETVDALVRALAPTTTAYTEIWLDGMRITGEEPPVDELYGPTYLPRKFKTAIAVEGDNCVDILSHDLGFIAHRGPGGGLAGYTVVVGGGLGRTHRKPDTMPLLAQPLAFVTADQAVSLARAVVGVQRDYGNRRDRRHARLKYVIAERGLEWFHDRVVERLTFTLQPPRAIDLSGVPDHLGWNETGDGLLSYGLFIPNGRIADTPAGMLRSMLRRLVRELRPRLVLTPQQNLLITGIHPRDRGRVEEILAVNAIRPLAAIPLVERNSLSCPALPTCGQAVAEAERITPDLLVRLDAEARRLGVADRPFSVRITGCPNGCARPYLGDVGLVGTTLGKYDVHLGGDREGTRLNDVFAENVPLDAIVDVIAGPLGRWAREGGAAEGFGDFCHRLGFEALRATPPPASPTQDPAVSAEAPPRLVPV